MKQTRVFHLIKSLGRGGAEVLLSEGLRFADRERFAYAFGYFLPWKDAVVPELEAQGADVVCFEARHPVTILLSAWRVARHLKAWGADLVHCHLPLAEITGRIAGKIAGVPVVCSEHGEIDRYRQPTRSANLLTWGWQERVIAVSHGVEASIRRTTDGRVPVETVLNGVDTIRFNADDYDGAPVREKYGIPAEAPVVGTVAVFRSNKQLHVWLEAARRIRQARPDAHFLVVGEGPLRDELEERRRALGLEEVVHFVGFQDEVRPFVAAMDLYMMSSRDEGLPIALLEAMAMGRPVVTTAAGGIPEVFNEPDNGGVLVEVGDAEALAEAALALLSDESRRRATAQAARRTVENRFSMQRMQRDLERLYLDVLRP